MQAGEEMSLATAAGHAEEDTTAPATAAAAAAAVPEYVNYLDVKLHHIANLPADWYEGATDAPAYTSHPFRYQVTLTMPPTTAAAATQGGAALCASSMLPLSTPLTTAAAAGGGGGEAATTGATAAVAQDATAAVTTATATAAAATPSCTTYTFAHGRLLQPCAAYTNYIDAAVPPAVPGMDEMLSLRDLPEAIDVLAGSSSSSNNENNNNNGGAVAATAATTAQHPLSGVSGSGGGAAASQGAHDANGTSTAAATQPPAPVLLWVATEATDAQPLPPAPAVSETPLSRRRNKRNVGSAQSTHSVASNASQSSPHQQQQLPSSSAMLPPHTAASTSNATSGSDGSSSGSGGVMTAATMAQLQLPAVPDKATPPPCVLRLPLTATHEAALEAMVRSGQALTLRLRRVLRPHAPAEWEDLNAAFYEAVIPVDLSAFAQPGSLTLTARAPLSRASSSSSHPTTTAADGVAAAAAGATAAAAAAAATSSPSTLATMTTGATTTTTTTAAAAAAQPPADHERTKKRAAARRLRGGVPATLYEEPSAAALATHPYIAAGTYATVTLTLKSTLTRLASDRVRPAITPAQLLPSRRPRRSTAPQQPQQQQQQQHAEDATTAFSAAVRRIAQSLLADFRAASSATVLRDKSSNSNNNTSNGADADAAGASRDARLAWRARFLEYVESTGQLTAYKQQLLPLIVRIVHERFAQQQQQQQQQSSSALLQANTAVTRAGGNTPSPMMTTFAATTNTTSVGEAAAMAVDTSSTALMNELYVYLLDCVHAMLPQLTQPDEQPATSPPRTHTAAAAAATTAMLTERHHDDDSDSSKKQQQQQQYDEHDDDDDADECGVVGAAWLQRAREAEATYEYALAARYHQARLAALTAALDDEDDMTAAEACVPDVWCDTAAFYMRVGDSVMAEQCYREALAHSPQHLRSLLGYSLLLMSYDRLDEAAVFVHGAVDEATAAVADANTHRAPQQQQTQQQQLRLAWSCIALLSDLYVLRTRAQAAPDADAVVARWTREANFAVLQALQCADDSAVTSEEDELRAALRPGTAARATTAATRPGSAAVATATTAAAQALREQQLFLQLAQYALDLHCRDLANLCLARCGDASSSGASGMAAAAAAVERVYARLFVQSGQYRDALDALERLRRCSERDVAAASASAAAVVTNGSNEDDEDDEAATAALVRAVWADEATVLRAHCAAALGQTGEAVTLYKQALCKQLCELPPYMTRLAQHRSPAAASAATAAATSAACARLYDGFVAGYLQLANLLLARGHYADALGVCTLAIAAWPCGLTWLGAGITYYRMGDYRAAEMCLSESNTRNTHNPRTWAYLALLCVRTRRANVAELTRQATLHGLCDAALWAELGHDVLYIGESPPLAEVCLRKALQHIHDDDDDDNDDNNNNAAKDKQQQQSPSSSLLLLQHTAAYHLAHALWQQRRHDEAHDVLHSLAVDAAVDDTLRARAEQDLQQLCEEM